MNKVAGVVLAGAAFAVAGGMVADAAAATAQPAAADPPGAFPYDLAFQMRELRRNDPPVVSPDGSRVAYVVVTPPDVRVQSSRFLPNGSPVDVMGARVHVTGADGRDAAICDGGGNQWNPSWSPDGRTLGFYSDADGKARLWAYTPVDGQCRKVSDALIRTSVFTGYQPHWSPDGRTVYVPLRPDPPLEVSDVGLPGGDEKAPKQASDDLAPAQVFFSGGEGQSAAGGKAGGNDGFMLAHYNATLAAIDLASGQARTIVDARAEPRPSTLRVSPSGRWMSYASVLYPPKEIAFTHVKDLLLVPTAGGAPRKLAEGLATSESNVNYTELDYRWHPTEDRLVYLKDGGAWTATVGAEGAQAPQRLGESLGELAPTVLYFTRDGRSVVVGTGSAGEGRGRHAADLALVPLDGGVPTRLDLPDPARWQFLDLVRANDDVLWQPDARQAHALLRDRSSGEQAVYRIDLATGASRAVASGLYQLEHFGSGGDHKQLFAVYQDIATPPDLYRYDAGLARKTRVSNVEPRVEGIQLGTAKVLENRVPLHDGTIDTVRTTLLLPHGAKAGDRLPAIVMIYSGSDLSTRATYYGGGMGNTVPSQVFTSRGFAVVMANVVLSAEGQPGNPIQQMVDILLPQVYAAANAGYIDMGRLAVSGQSYGGYSTGAIVSQTHLFRAGIPVNGLFDLMSSYGRMDEMGDSHGVRWSEAGQGRMGDSPWANPQRYIDNSPYYRADRIRTPLLIVAGERDTTVPYEESKKLFVALRRMERPAQLAIYPGEGHVISTWSVAHAADVSQRMVEFLRKHLGAP